MKKIIKSFAVLAGVTLCCAGLIAITGVADNAADQVLWSTGAIVAIYAGYKLLDKLGILTSNK